MNVDLTELNDEELAHIAKMRDFGLSQEGYDLCSRVLQERALRQGVQARLEHWHPATSAPDWSEGEE